MQGRKTQITRRKKSGKVGIKIQNLLNFKTGAEVQNFCLCFNLETKTWVDEWYRQKQAEKYNIEPETVIELRICHAIAMIQKDLNKKTNLSKKILFTVNLKLPRELIKAIKDYFEYGNSQSTFQFSKPKYENQYIRREILCNFNIPIEIADKIFELYQEELKKQTRRVIVKKRFILPKFTDEREEAKLERIIGCNYQEFTDRELVKYIKRLYKIETTEEEVLGYRIKVGYSKQQ